MLCKIKHDHVDVTPDTLYIVQEHQEATHSNSVSSYATIYVTEQLRAGPHPPLYLHTPTSNLSTYLVGIQVDYKTRCLVCLARLTSL